MKKKGGAKKITIELNTVCGLVRMRAATVWDAQEKKYYCPLKQLLGIEHARAMTPELEERLALTATDALSYAAASRIAETWGTRVSDSTIHRHVEHVGHAMEEVRQREVDRALDPSTRGEVVAEAARRNHGQSFSLVIMMDGWMVRQRDEEWGLKPAAAKADRVAWREMKTGIVFRANDRAETQSGRRVLIEKRYEAVRSDPEEFGRRLYALALREGLHQAEQVFVIADGAVWIWNLAKERFGRARQLLDFYHASEHLWAVAHALHADDESAAREWVEPLLHQLRHGGEHGVVETLEDLLEINREISSERTETIRENAGYFHNNRDRLGYEAMEERGGPVGSGAMESTCSQLQDRFKRTGQFWTDPGLAHLIELEIIKRNCRWTHYWSAIS